jgi:hypothetical protein
LKPIIISQNNKELSESVCRYPPFYCGKDNERHIYSAQSMTAAKTGEAEQKIL